MSDENIRRLPLLEAFDAILTHGSVGAAAEAMHVTQSAVSKQLGQLRLWLDDELFVRTRAGMEPTPRAIELRAHVHGILTQAAALTEARAPAPADFEGRFVLSATDEVLARLLPALMERLAAEAPRLRLVTLPVSRDYSIRQLETGQVDLLVTVDWHAPDQLLQRKLGGDPFVCVMHERHPLADKKLTLTRYAEATHVLVAPFGHREGVVDLALRELGRTRVVCASLYAFHLLGLDTLGRTRIATVPSRVAAQLADRGPFVTRRVPLTLPETHYYALWHPRFAADHRLRWMLENVRARFAET